MKKTILALILALFLTSFSAYADEKPKFEPARDDQPLVLTNEPDTDASVPVTPLPQIIDDQKPDEKKPAKPAQ